MLSETTKLPSLGVSSNCASDIGCLKISETNKSNHIINQPENGGRYSVKALGQTYQSVSKPVRTCQTLPGTLTLGINGKARRLVRYRYIGTSEEGARIAGGEPLSAGLTVVCYGIGCLPRHDG